MPSFRNRVARVLLGTLLLSLQGVESSFVSFPSHIELAYSRPFLSSSHASCSPFASTTTTTRLLLENPSTGSEKKSSSVSYSDDAFGLIFISTAFLAKDYVFGGIFLTLSTIAATATNVGKFTSSQRVVRALPGGVAALSLALRTIILLSPMMQESSAQLVTELGLEGPSSSAFATECAVCTVSVGWAVYQFVMTESSSSSSSSSSSDEK